MSKSVERRLDPLDTKDPFGEPASDEIVNALQLVLKDPLTAVASACEMIAQQNAKLIAIRDLIEGRETVTIKEIQSIMDGEK